MMAGREMKLLMELSTFIVSSFNTREQKIPTSNAPSRHTEGHQHGHTGAVWLV